MLTYPAVAAINHLLAQNDWARQRLLRFAGKTVRIEASPLVLVWAILPDGTLGQADVATSADAVCMIPPSALPRLAVQDERVHAQIRNEGDAALLAEIFYLFRNLRWDAAEDLSRVSGDVAAERIVGIARLARRQATGALLSLSQAAVEFWTEERPVIAKPRRIEEFAAGVDALRDDLARLEQRIRRLQPRDPA